MANEIKVFSIPCLYEREIQRKPKLAKKNNKHLSGNTTNTDSIDDLLNRVLKGEEKKE